MTGLCKLATREEVASQDYSLNPGRYVGVVIEEDGRTEAEFRAELLAINAELETLNAEAAEVAAVISHNVGQIAGDISCGGIRLEETKAEGIHSVDAVPQPISR